MFTNLTDDRTPFKLAIQNSVYGYKTTNGTFVAFRGDSTATYTYATNSTGGTVDMGARNNYRYVNATNVYNKGKADGTTAATFIPAGKDMDGTATLKDFTIAEYYGWGFAIYHITGLGITKIAASAPGHGSQTGAIKYNTIAGTTVTSNLTAGWSNYGGEVATALASNVDYVMIIGYTSSQSTVGNPRFRFLNT